VRDKLMKVKKEGLQIKLELTREDYYSSVKRMLNILIPDIEVVNDDSAEVVITSNLKVDTDKIKLKTKLVSSDTELMKKDIDTEIRDARYTDGDIERRCRSKVKFHIYQLLVKFLDLTPSPWGILIGVRPTKIGHFLMDKGFDYNEIKNNLQSTYGVSNEKADLLLRIVKKERIYLPTKEEVKDRVSIYIGIPFCPSRCGYCSFPAYGLKDAAKYISPFLKSLHYEIREVGSWLAKNGITVDTIYLGGGTPTTLNEEQLKELLAIIKESFYHLEVREFNVEAGRPDTITKKKLELLKEYNVNRISINPQTMNQGTLKAIGRDHTIREVKDAFKLARQVGFNNINMDLIIGLPGEDEESFTKTVQDIEELNPDNLTVHTMAMKRASRWKQNSNKLDFPQSEEVRRMLALSKQLAINLGVEPYYMYRQKYMLGNLENIGYAKPGLESIYNIIMMEERETVIGLGGGAITKLVNPEDWTIARLNNPKQPQDYIREVEERTTSKLQRLTSLFR